MMTLELSGFSVAIEGIKFSSLLSKISRISKKTLRSYESFVKMHYINAAVTWQWNSGILENL